MSTTRRTQNMQKLNKAKKKKKSDSSNMHATKLTFKKYGTYKLGNFKNKSIRSYFKDTDVYSLRYMEISSHFSNRPKKKLCDFTGLPADFTCPTSGISYYDSSVFKCIRGLSSDKVSFVYSTKEMCKNYNPFNNNY